MICEEGDAAKYRGIAEQREGRRRRRMRVIIMTSSSLTTFDNMPARAHGRLPGVNTEPILFIETTIGAPFLRLLALSFVPRPSSPTRTRQGERTDEVRTWGGLRPIHLH